jgi:hypothetical protein
MTGRIGNRTDLDLNFQDPETWISSNLANPLVRALGSAEAAKDWIGKALDSADLFRKSHEAVKAEQNAEPSALPKMTTFFSRAYRTPTRVLVKTEGSGSEVRITHVVRPAMFAPGDGVISVEGLRLGDGWDYDLIPSYQHHAGLLNDLSGVEMGLLRNVLR